MLYNSLEMKPGIVKKSRHDKEKHIFRMEFVPNKVLIGSPIFEGNYYDKKFGTITEAEHIRRSTK